jgi:hypothetical protein
VRLAFQDPLTGEPRALRAERADVAINENPPKQAAAGYVGRCLEATDVITDEHFAEFIERAITGQPAVLPRGQPPRPCRLQFAPGRSRLGSRRPRRMWWPAAGARIDLEGRAGPPAAPLAQFLRDDDLAFAGKTRGVHGEGLWRGRTTVRYKCGTTAGIARRSGRFMGEKRLRAG